MSLPDISGFSRLSAAEWRAFGLRLSEIGLTSAYLEPVVQTGGDLPPNLRLPIHQWHLERMSEPAAASAALLMFEDAVPEKASSAALGPALLERLLEAGLIARRPDGRIVSPFRLSIADRLYIFSDDLAHGGDAVMGASEATTQLCRAAYPAEPVGCALEIGCGAGTIALVLAQRTQRVIATDINPRALAMARMNATVNGIENVEFRQGDAFSPVASEVFDLIVSQPPFVARPAGARDAAYLYGGIRGDELASRLLQDVSDHLKPRGRAVTLVQWADCASAPACDHARVLQLRYPPADLDVHCAMYAAAESGGDNAAYAERFAAWRDHLEQLGIRALQSSLTVIQRDPAAPAWTAAVDIAPDCADTVTSAQIDRIIAAHDLARAPDLDLLQATLRLPDGIVFAKEYTLDEQQPPRIVARLPESSLGQSVDLSEASLLLISLVAEAATVGDAVDKFAARRALAADQGAEQMLPAIRQALRLGVLAPTDRPEA